MIFLLLLIAGAAYLLVTYSRRHRAAQPEVPPVGWVAGTKWSVLRPLARVELRRLLLHPATVIGAALSPLVILLALDDPGTHWSRVSANLALAIAPFGWCVIVGADLLTTRPMRTGNADLFATLPTPQPVRTGALTATMIGPFVAAIAILGFGVVFAASTDSFTGRPNIGELAAGALLGAGAVAVGVAIARYLSHPIFGLGGAIAVILIQARFLDVTTWPWDKEEAHPIRFLGFLASPTSGPARLEFRPAWWHVVYLVGLIGVMVVIALARDGVGRPVAGALAVALGVAAIGGWEQTRPAPSHRVAEMVRYLERPSDFQTCTTNDTARYCVFDDDGDPRKVAEWQARVTALQALAPLDLTKLEVRERVPTRIGNSSCSAVPFTSTLVKAVATRIEPEVVWAADGVVHPGVDELPCSDTSVHGYFFATQVASWAVGLPSSPHGDDQRCYADAEARSVIALWLGAAASPEGAAHLRALAGENDRYIAFSGWNNPPMWGVHFRVGDAYLALSLFNRPTAQVAAALRGQWARLTAKGTPTSELETLLGLPATTTSPAAQHTCA